MSARDGYLGRAPGDSQVVIAKQKFEPTGVQTNFTFTSGYTVGYIDVYVNGLRKVNASDYTASDGSTVNLTSSVGVGTVVELVAYKAFNVANPISNTTSGSLEVGVDLTVTGTSNVGVVTGGTYYGDGSNLTGLPGQVDLWNKTAAGINTAVSVGIGTTRPDSIARVNNTSILNVGILTAYKVYANGDLDVDGHTELDNVNIAGVSTFGAAVSIADSIVHTGDTDTSIRFPAANTFTVDTGGSERIRVDSSGNLGVGTITPATSRRLHIADSTTAFSQWTTGTTGSSHVDGTLVGVQADSSFQIWNYENSYFRIATNNGERFRIDPGGNVNITGIVTATSFKGPTNVPAGQSGTVTLAASDAGKHVAATGTVTLGTDIFAVGDAVTIYNNSGSGISITLSAVTCYNAADGTTGNRTLGARGLATILCTAANTYVISGAGLS